ncbi:MAG: peptidylprolyl isomerase [Myxococcota bacterium]|jgi:peptidylprolyl isomerase
MIHRSNKMSDDIGVQVNGEVGQPPAITLPEGAPPAGLELIDLVVGDGDEAPAGSTVTVNYAGVSWTNEGRGFDSSFERGQPLTFPLSRVIAGWQQGIPGMKVGGRRVLVVPPTLGYGTASPTPAIASNDTLVFVVDLLRVD